MAINIQNLLNVVQAKLNATTPTTPALEFSRLSSVSDMLEDHGAAVKSYPGLATFPTADSANHGDIAYSLDSAAYRISEQLAWREITLNADSVIAAAAVYSFQGSTSGYTSGGTPGNSNVIEKFPFSSDANATDVGDLTVGRSNATGQSSSVSGYTSAGWLPGASNIIDKFPFSSDGNATDVGDITARAYLAGQSSSASGYSSGGSNPGVPTLYNIIDKFPFSSDANATDVGDLTVGRYIIAGQSSTDNGYTSGGNTGSESNVIDKFPFSSDANATDVGNLTVARFAVAGQSSTVSGYTSGGRSSPTFFNTIDKFPFSSDGNATDVGDLSVTRGYLAGQSSTVSGYTSSGLSPPLTPAYSNIIDKFPFASDANATDVGDLTAGKYVSAGQQV